MVLCSTFLCSTFKTNANSYIVQGRTYVGLLCSFFPHSTCPLILTNFEECISKTRTLPAGCQPFLSICQPSGALGEGIRETVVGHSHKVTGMLTQMGAVILTGSWACVCAPAALQLLGEMEASRSPLSVGTTSLLGHRAVSAVLLNLGACFCILRAKLLSFGNSDISSVLLSGV